MGVYCFGKLFEEEGQLKKIKSENTELRGKIFEMVQE